jgi:hypothetical protein
VTGVPGGGNGHYVANDGRTFITVRNADEADPHTVTVGLLSVDGQAVEGKAYAIPASSSRNIRLGAPTLYGTRTNLDVDDADLKLTAYKIA